MENSKPIYIGKGIIEQIKDSYCVSYTITKKKVFDYWMQCYKEFYKEYPYAIRWNYEEFIREILDYYE